MIELIKMDGWISVLEPGLTLPASTRAKQSTDSFKRALHKFPDTSSQCHSQYCYVMRVDLKARPHKVSTR